MRGDTLAFAHQTEEEVLRSDVVVVETDGLVLGKREHSLRAVVKAVERSHLLRLLKVYRRNLASGSDYTFASWSVRVPNIEFPAA